VIVLAIIVNCFMLGVATARDTPIPIYTGTSGAYSGSGWTGGSIFTTLMEYSSATLSYYIQLSAPIENLQETTQCAFNCIEYFTGTLGAGTISFSGWDASGRHLPYNFTGLIIYGGTFDGAKVWDGIGWAIQDSESLTFQSQSGDNGWWSMGGIQHMGGCVDGGCGGFATLSIHTYAPEPGGLMLLGSESWDLAACCV
jgi:hypothetical protein